MTTTAPAPRLSLLLARSADSAVIFRRGPSKHVEVVRWDTFRDRFERGHWFSGRIYEKRSDLSPDGELLIYFASQFTGESIRDKEYTYAWTAISRPPWLTALALWPKGDCWWGGGLFTGKKHVWLNHLPEESTPHKRHKPHGLEIESNPEARGENGPIYAKRLDRDGWELAQGLEALSLPKLGGFETVQPEIRVRRHRRHPFRIIKEVRVDGRKRREGFTVVGPSGGVALPAGRIDWVDWDRDGRLIILVEGTICAARVGPDHVEPATQLLDLGTDVFETRTPPPAAREW